MSCQTTTNPVPISVQPGTKLNIICSAFAFFQQQVILSFNQNMSQRIGTFSGSGEQVPMHLANGQTSLTVPTGSNQTLFVRQVANCRIKLRPSRLVNPCRPCWFDSLFHPERERVILQSLARLQVNNHFCRLCFLS